MRPVNRRYKQQKAYANGWRAAILQYQTRSTRVPRIESTRARAHTRLWNSSFPPSNGILQASVVSPSSSNNWVAMLFVDPQPYIRVSKYLVKPLPQKWKRIRSVSTCCLITHLHCEFVFLAGWYRCVGFANFDREKVSRIGMVQYSLDME